MAVKDWTSTSIFLSLERDRFLFFSPDSIVIKRLQEGLVVAALSTESEVPFLSDYFLGGNSGAKLWPLLGIGSVYVY